MTKSPAVLLIGHGTRIHEGVAQFHRFTHAVREALADRPCTLGFLELATPTIEDGLRELIHQGAHDIIAMPVMLLAAGHMKRDIPAILKTLQARYPDVHIRYGVELGVHRHMLEAAKERIESCETQFSPGYQRTDTLLMVVGRGTSDPDANGNVAKLTRMLWEGMGFGWGAVSYVAVTQPRVAAGLECVHRLGYKRVIVFPYVLFTGRLIQDIHTAVDAYQHQHRDVTIVKAPYFSDHPLVVRTLLERLEQVENSRSSLDCALCRHSTQWPAFNGHGEHDHHHHHSHQHQHHHHDPL